MGDNLQTTDINTPQDYQGRDIMIDILAELQKIKKNIKISNDKLDTLIAKP